MHLPAAFDVVAVRLIGGQCDVEGPCHDAPHALPHRVSRLHPDCLVQFIRPTHVDHDQPRTNTYHQP
ncbi:MAG: hypothetical protein ACRD1G_01445, partial [Acidimicrobiales bacterium]